MNGDIFLESGANDSCIAAPLEAVLFETVICMPSGHLHRRHQSQSSLPPSASAPSNADTLSKTHSLPAHQFLSPRGRRMNEADKMISPRSSNYERLEGGMGPSRMGMRNFQWKKLAIGVVVIVGLVWVFTPSERMDSVLGGIKRPGPGAFCPFVLNHALQPRGLSFCTVSVLRTGVADGVSASASLEGS
ncbi:hypothetical protein EVG20_g9026 [Dentipellis fragilis]|uniref:Uncharacterized protein n=1 Tax=Dentipellis fragilis TaxID=205917 RepID=A0A4Y9Y3M6_9AGAM|nr:hypothetical protein EVG20_g9026 [Dentipellis fragilis]